MRRLHRFLLRATVLATLALGSLGAGSAFAATSTVSGTVATTGTTAALSDVHVELLTTALSSAVTSVTATSTGSFSFSGVPAGSYYVYAYDSTAGDNDAPSFYGGATLATATLLHVDGTDPAAVGTITLPAGGTIAGTVTSSSTATPVAKGTVEVLAEPSLAPVLAFDDEATVQANGSYTVGGLPAGRYLVEYNGDGSAPYDGIDVYSTSGATMNLEAGSAVSVTLGTTGTANFSLPSAGSLTGTITQAATNTPLTAVLVDLFDSSGALVDETETTDGAYAFNGLIDGKYRIEAIPGVDELADLGVAGAPLAFQFYTGASTLSTATPITVSGTATMSNINLSLSAGGSISGTVTSAQGGAPIAGETVSLVDETGNVLESTNAANDGTYTLPNVPAGTFYVRFGGASYLQLLGTLFTQPAFADEFYGGSPTLAGATPVTLEVQQNLTGINGVLLPSSTARIGLPTVTKLTLSGLHKRAVALSFNAAPGTGVSADLAKVSVRLPSGLSWNTGKLGRDLSLGSAKFKSSISKGVLTLSFRPGQRGFSLRVKAGGISDTKALALKATAKAVKSETVTVTLTTSQGIATKLSLVVKRPT